jgi:hypothetical protein
MPIIGPSGLHDECVAARPDLVSRLRRGWSRELGTSPSEREQWCKGDLLQSSVGIGLHLPTAIVRAFPRR